MKKREFLQLGAAAAALAVPAAVHAQGASHNWKMATGWSGGPAAGASSTASATWT